MDEDLIRASSMISLGVEGIEVTRSNLFPELLRDEAVTRLNELGKVSDADGYLERTFLSPGSIRAANLIRTWMEDAGLTTWMDQMGNVHGRTEGMQTNGKALLMGSHLDTVIDAGIFDGSLGILSALSALKVLNITGRLKKLRRPVEVIAFSDEEGVRFQSTFLGSAAIAGVLPVSALHIRDKSGLTVQHVLKENSIETNEENLLRLKYDPESVWGYIEIHIEQGPVLESAGLPLGVVEGIAGQTRLKSGDKGPINSGNKGGSGPLLEIYSQQEESESDPQELFPQDSTSYKIFTFELLEVSCGHFPVSVELKIITGDPCTVLMGSRTKPLDAVTVRGSQGHAGTVPMSMRQDPMAAAAELIVLLESLCKNPKDFLSYDGQCSAIEVESLGKSLVCTVGEISTWPSASNVIPGQVTFTVDIRAVDDMGREAIIYELSNRVYQICDRRSVACIIERKHDANAVICDTELSSQLKSAAYSALKRMTGEDVDNVPVLMSGAGHDVMAMSHIAKVGMLFVRCRGGVSHSPAEYVLDDDVWAAGLAILAILETLL
ncbi:unnamed protein product [Ilex paraguariensis]|uniref:allantoate deiminase n=1 Tax=Ilex paraguariensis TaxID=185542 RepID=A0ABC8R4G0_9AQUA